ncbi:MAG TPA: type III pantothenate kinase, partial [Candidatus Eisenbacteria bacterium]
MPESRASRAGRGGRGRRRGAAAARRPRGSLVTVDIGNSDTVVGVFEGVRLRDFWRLTSGRATADEVTLQLERLTRGAGARPAGAVLCSVVPALTQPWAEALRRWSGRAPLEVGAATARSLPIRYHD